MKKSFLFLFLTIVSVSCSDDNPTPGNYFPLEAGTVWNYELYQTDAKEAFGDFMSEARRFVKGDSVIDGSQYVLYEDQLGAWAVRREGSAYYQRFSIGYPSGFSDEYKFLDTEKSVGFTWDQFPGPHDFVKVTFSIRSRNASRKFLDKVYTNLIVVEEQHLVPDGSGGWNNWRSIWRYYAPGIGEIYSYAPYPLSNMFLDVSTVLKSKTGS
jgi:hypothetical protein